MKGFSFFARQTQILLLSAAVLLADGKVAVRAQSALDGFNPNADGTVYAIAVQADGKILVGGSFTNVLGVARNRIARLNPDGTLDTAFNPNADNFILSITLQADSKILVGGAFTNIGGQTRNSFARLDATTGLADSFDPNADNTVRSIAVQADGKIVAGGNFTIIGGQTRNHIARLDATTGQADSFNPNANSAIYAIAVQADGKIVAGGFFNGANSIGGQTRNYIARLDPTTGLPDSFNPNANSGVYSIALQADGKIVAGGFFNGANSIGGQTRNYIARLDATTGLADSFDPNPDGIGVFAIAVQADGKILVSGYFGTIGGQSRAYFARLDATTGLADSFAPNANNTVHAIAVQADGKVLLGGDFTMLSPNGGAAVTRNHIARLETDGRLDRTLNAAIANSTVSQGYVAATAVQPDGKILIGGNFDAVFGVARNSIARLNPDGTLDTAFNPNANNSVLAISVQADGKILVGGYFSGIGGQARNRIARLDAVTGLADTFNPNAGAGFQPDFAVNAIAVQGDGKILVGGDFRVIGGLMRWSIARLDGTTGSSDSFNPNASNAVYAIAVQPDGKVLAGGAFTGIGGQTRNRIARLDATTGLADSFDPNAANSVFALAVQADGKVLAGGAFTNISGQASGRIARLNANGTLDAVFSPNANSDVYSIAVQTDGMILVGGAFNGTSSIGGQSRYGIARLDAATGLADSFDPNAANSVFALAVQADGKVLAGGAFTGVGGQSRQYFARLSNGTAALQTLAVTRITITWTRGGSSPQLTRVTFEYSTDNVNYTPLGNGTAAGTNWTLTGLNLPTGQSLYIRARGHYRSGYLNGSESITESTRNVFLPPQPLLNIQRSANTDVVLSWATNFTGFTLEANTNLTTNIWSVVSPPPAVSGTNNVVTNAVSSPTRFYRLRK